MEEKQQDTLFNNFTVESNGEAPYLAVCSEKDRPVKARKPKKILSFFQQAPQNPSLDVEVHHCNMYGTKFFSNVPVLKKSITTQSTCFENVPKEEIQIRIFNFLEGALSNKELFNSYIEAMKFSQSSSHTIWINDSENINISVIDENGKMKSSDQSSENHSSVLKNNSSLCFGSYNLTKSISINLDIEEPQKKWRKTSEKENDSPPSGGQQNSLNLINSNKSFQISLVYDKKMIMSRKNPDLVEQVSIILERSFRERKQSQNQNQVSMVFCEEFQSDSLLSASDVEKYSIEQIRQKLPKSFSLQFIQDIFCEPEPFLMNLSLCLLLKYFSKRSESEDNISKDDIVLWLPVSTLVAYKIFEDLPMLGLMGFISEVTGLETEELKFLERVFLNQIDYEIIVSNSQYFRMLSFIINRSSK